MNELFRKFANAVSNIKGARTGLVNLEQFSDQELEELHKEFERSHRQNPTLQH